MDIIVPMIQLNQKVVSERLNGKNALNCAKKTRNANFGITGWKEKVVFSSMVVR